MFRRVVSSLLEVRGRRSEISRQLTHRRPGTTDHGPRTRSCFLSPAPSPLSPRPGISLTEVLIAMGILTVGLLGVASLFPVGAFYMENASKADNGSAIAQEVMSDIATRGILNPGGWYVMTPNPPPPATMT